MSTDILLSIVVPIYNREHSLPALMATLLATKSKQVEIVLVNDGSKDNSLAVCKEFAAQDARVRVINKENGGVSSARNAGLDVAKGKFLAFFDGDDLIVTDTLDCAIDRLESCTEDLIIFDFIHRNLQTNTDKKSHFILPCDHVLAKDEIIQQILAPLLLCQGTDLPSVWNKFFSLAFLQANHLRFEENVSYGEDWRFVVDTLDVCSSVRYIPESLYIYLQDGTQVSGKYKRIAGIHLLGAAKRKLCLSEKYGILMSQASKTAIYAEILSDVVFCATNRCNKKVLASIFRDPIVLQAACRILSLDKEERCQADLTRRNVLDAVFIKYRCVLLLRLTHHFIE